MSYGAGNVTELLNRSVAASREAQAIAQELQEAIVPMKENMTEWQKRLGDAPADGQAYRDALISANRTSKWPFWIRTCDCVIVDIFKL